MNQPIFPSTVEMALNSYKIGPLPDGFADRLLARLAAGNLPEVSEMAAAQLVTGKSRAVSSPWRRSGRILGSTALFGLVTAAAAASGILGDPVYVPMISEALGKTQITQPAKAEKPPEKIALPKKALPVAAPEEKAAVVTGKDAVKLNSVRSPLLNDAFWFVRK
jgi:hypothetical protein